MFIYFAQSCLKEKHVVGSENKLPLTSPETLQVCTTASNITKDGNDDNINALVFNSLKVILKKATMTLQHEYRLMYYTVALYIYIATYVYTESS